MNPRHRTPRPLAALAAALACAGLLPGAQAAVSPSGGPDLAGRFTDIAYGSSGNVFELVPQLFITGLGSAGSPSSVTALNPALDYSVQLGGVGTGLMTIDYRITNKSMSESFSQLRFMVFANPDGQQTDFLDRASESWGAALPGEAARREVHAFTSDPFNSILGRFSANANLTDGPPDAACLAPGGCDAVMGLQWNTATLGPNERLTLRLALSDDGQSISGRSLSFAGVGAGGSSLTVSGLATVAAVPEPSTWAMALAGLVAVGSLARRRSAASRG